MNTRKKKIHPGTPLIKRRVSIRLREMNLNPRKIFQAMSIDLDNICDETSTTEGSSWVSASESKSSELEDDVFVPKKTTEAGVEKDVLSSPETMRRSGVEKDETWSLDPLFWSEDSNESNAKGSKGNRQKKILHSPGRNTRMGPITPYLEEFINFSSINSYEISTSSKSECQSDNEKNSEQPQKSLKRSGNKVLHSTGCEKMDPISPHFEELFNLSPVNISLSRESNEPVSPNDAKRKSEHSKNGLKRSGNKVLHSTGCEKMGPISPFFEELLNLSPVNIGLSRESNEPVPPNDAKRKSEHSKNGLKRRQVNKMLHSTELEKTLRISPLFEEPISFPMINTSLSRESNEPEAKEKSEQPKNAQTKSKRASKTPKRNRTSVNKKRLFVNESSKRITAPKPKRQREARRQKSTLDPVNIEVVEKEMEEYKEYLKTIPICDLSLRKNIFKRKKNEI